MTIFSLELGNDGVGGLRNYPIEVNGGFSLQEMADNFDNNASLFYYDPATLDGPEFPVEILLEVVKAGMPFTTPEGHMPLFYGEDYEDGFETVQEIEEFAAEGGEIYASLDGMIGFLMFLVGYGLAGHGLDGFSWSHVDRPVNLLDMAKSTKDHDIAVGLVEEYAMS